MYTAAEVQADLATLKSLSVRVVSTAELMEEAVNIAIAYGISAYDASYVALSHRVSSPLLTKTQLPFLNILGEHSQIELPKLAQATVELVDRICQEVRRVNWASPTVQEDLRRWIADYLDTNDLVDYDQLEEVADKLVQLARKNRDSLMA